jgi:hypothetical protein
MVAWLQARFVGIQLFVLAQNRHRVIRVEGGMQRAKQCTDLNRIGNEA